MKFDFSIFLEPNDLIKKIKKEEKKKSEKMISQFNNLLDELYDKISLLEKENEKKKKKEI